MEESRKKTPAIKPLIDLIIVVIVCAAVLKFSPTVRGILFDRVYNASPQIAIKFLADKEDVVTAKELLQYEIRELSALDIGCKKVHFYGILPSLKDSISLLAYPDYNPENGERIIEGSRDAVLFDEYALLVSKFDINYEDMDAIQAEPGYVEVEGYIGLASKNKINLRVTSLKSAEYDDISWEEGQLISKKDFKSDRVVEVHKQIGKNGKYNLETIEFCRLGAAFWYAPSGKGTDYSVDIKTSDGRESSLLCEMSDEGYQFIPWVQPSESLNLKYDMGNEEIVSTGETFEITVDTL